MLAIPEYAFAHRNELEEVELHNNIFGIGQYAFLYCTALKEVLTSDRVVEKIGQLVFYGCSLTKFRNPLLVTTVPHGMLYCCRCMFSLELSENDCHVERLAFGYSYSLRNIALTFNTIIAYNVFFLCYDLLHIFGTEEAIVNAVKSRFYELPFHGMCTTILLQSCDFGYDPQCNHY